MKSEDKLKQELAKVQGDIQKIGSELSKHSAQIVELEGQLAKGSPTSSVEELLETNRTIFGQLRKHIEEKAYLAVPLKSLRGRESYLEKRLFEFERERQIEQYNQRLLHLYDVLIAYNDLVEQANGKLREIKKLYYQKLPEEYRSGADTRQILKSPIAAPHHIPSQPIKPMKIWNEEKLLEARSNGS